MLPFRSSNAMTSLSCNGLDAFQIVRELRTHHNIVVAPSGGQLKSKVIRIAHMGAQDDADLKSLVTALQGITSPDACTSIERIEI